jgi:NAD(P)-dependent dehydrogenase (short-subunit alcohol dehydrogenase family)
VSGAWHVVVTGSSGGIGRAVCEWLLQQGHSVTGMDKTTLPGAAWNQLDVDLTQADAAFSAGQHARASAPVTHLVHCAALQILGAAGEITDDAWQDSLRVNVLAVEELVRACVDDLRQARGAIVAVSSVHAVATTRSMAAYATTKAALQGWVKAAALDLAPEVRVNAVQPGAVRTDMLTAGLSRWSTVDAKEESLRGLASKTPLGVIADPEDIAEVVGFLLERRSRFITGSTLAADGGALLRLGTE